MRRRASRARPRALPCPRLGSTAEVSRTRRRTSLAPKGVWVHIKQSYIKRIKGGMLRAAARVLDGTPKGLICTLCWKRLTLTQDRSRNGGNGAFLTTVALAHLRDV